MWMWIPGIPQYFPLSNPRNSSCLPIQALEILRPNSAFLGSDVHCDLLDCWDPCQLCNAAIRTPLLICLIGQWVVSDSSFGFWETPMKKDDIFENNQRQSTRSSYTVTHSSRSYRIAIWSINSTKPELNSKISKIILLHVFIGECFRERMQQQAGAGADPRRPERIVRYVSPQVMPW